MAKKGFLKRKFGEVKKEISEGLAHRKEVKTLETKTFRKEQKKQTKIFAKQAALQERKQRVAKLKAKGRARTEALQFGMTGFLGTKQSKKKKINIGDFI